MGRNFKDRINLDATVSLNERIGKRIHDLRRSQHITQEQLAEALDISIKHVSAVERGLSALSLERLIDVSYILNCSLEYLILGEKSRDISSMLPQYVIEIMKRNEIAEMKLFMEYLDMYRKLRDEN